MSYLTDTAQGCFKPTLEGVLSIKVGRLSTLKACREMREVLLRMVEKTHEQEKRIRAERERRKAER